MRSSVLISIFAVLLLGQPADGAAQPAPGGGQGRGRPKIVFEEDSTPLQKAVEGAVSKRRDHGQKTPGHSKRKLGSDECPDCGNRFNPAGKLVGKKVATETILQFREPGERGKASWDPIKMKNRRPGTVGHDIATPASDGSGGPRRRSASQFPTSSSNDDKDCVNITTGARKGGYADPEGPSDPSNLVPDGDERSCYEADGALKAGYEELLDEDGSEQIDDDSDGLMGEDPVGDTDGDGNPNDDLDCIRGPKGKDVDPNDNGETRRGAECRAQDGSLAEGFVELVDEDGDEPVDEDADGRFDEDPPASFEAGCQAFGADGYTVTMRSKKDGSTQTVRVPHRAGLVVSNGSDECDVTRAVMVAVNDAVKQHPANKDQKRAFKVKDDGTPDEGSGVEYGTEPRQVALTEEYTIRCDDPDAELVDGECVSPPSPGPAASMASGAGASDATMALLATTSATDRAMMGFTFAPPVIEWGFKIQEEVCINLIFDELCFEVFFARVGYEFDLAAGLRLPVEVTLDKLPSPSALAGEQVTLDGTVQPLDFTVGDYRQFCEKHHLDREWFIDSCERFAFVDFIDSFNPFTTGDEKDGAEFVARAEVFAGVVVRVLSIPIVSWGIDTNWDLPALCTALQLMDEKINLLEFGIDLVKTGSLGESLKSQLGNCSSFTTPFGYEDDPLNPGVRRLRSFPIAKSFDIRADCAQALVEGETFTIKGKKRPICTNLLLGINGASLGVGLGVEFAAGSQTIRADMTADGDARATAHTIRFRHEPTSSEPEKASVGPITFDNYDGTAGSDKGYVQLDDFTYFLDTIQIRLKANLEFGGVLDFIPDLDSFTIWSFHFNTEDDLGIPGIPIGQHAGTEPIRIPVFVENHALALDAQPAADDVNRVDDNTLLVQPGAYGTFEVRVQNLGNVTGDFDNFARALSNWPNQGAGPFTFVINPNTDFDCIDASGARFRGYPYDNVSDACFTDTGALRADRTEASDEDPFGPAGAPVAIRDEDADGLADEDPPDSWPTLPANFGEQSLAGIAPGNWSSAALTLSVSPFRHPLTAPGLYPVQVTADSRTARVRGLAPVDPSGLRRLEAADVVFVKVDSFFDPNVALLPPSTSDKPGVTRTYTVEGENGGNNDDSIDITVQFVDSNQAGCTLTTMGGPGCPYRAAVTQMPAAWTTIGDLGPRYGPLAPLGRAQDSFSVLPPSDWAGMQDTTYQFVITGTSTADPGQRRAWESTQGGLVVMATKASMTRYVGLELAELIQRIQATNAEGTKTAGLLPLSGLAQRFNDEALAKIATGDLPGGSKSLGQAQTIMEAFVRSLDGFSGGETRFAQAPDFRARADAILQDLAQAQSSMVIAARP